VNSEHKETRWAEISGGRRVYKCEEVCPGDIQKFKMEYVSPIEQLVMERKIGGSKTVGRIQANKEVLEVHITGEVAS
jgi:hypothetical protein